jgi:hypothetical protein
MLHHFFWLVTVGKDVQKIGWRHEVESWEGHSLGVHEFIQGFLTNGEVFLNLLKSWENVVLNGELNSLLLFVTIIKDFSDCFVNFNELD